MEKLAALHQTALDKFARVAEVRAEGQQVALENNRILAAFPPNLTAKRLEKATREHERATMQTAAHDLAQKTAACAALVGQLEAELDTYREAFATLAAQVDEEEVATVRHMDQCRDTLMMPKEQLLMAAEELRTVQLSIAADQRAAATDSPTSDWLKRVIKTTKIQRKGKEQELASAEERFNTLTS